MTSTTVQIWQTSAGYIVLAQGDEAWTSVTDVTDEAAYTEAAVSWSRGEWQPSEGDGWERVPGSWTDEVERDDVATGDRPRLLAEWRGVVMAATKGPATTHARRMRSQSGVDVECVNGEYMVVQRMTAEDARAIAVGVGPNDGLYRDLMDAAHVADEKNEELSER